MSKKKKIFILSGMILLLASTAVFNFMLTSSSANSPDDGSIQTGTFFSNYRTERSTTRNEEILYLDAIIAASEAESEAAVNATNQKMKIIETMEKELLLENLIKTKGFEDVVVTIGTTSNNVNVIVSDSELSKEEVAVIFNIIKSETDVTAEYVKIIPV